MCPCHAALLSVGRVQAHMRVYMRAYGCGHAGGSVSLSCRRIASPLDVENGLHAENEGAIREGEVGVRTVGKAGQAFRHSGR